MGRKKLARVLGLRGVLSGMLAIAVPVTTSLLLATSAPASAASRVVIRSTARSSSSSAPTGVAAGVSAGDVTRVSDADLAEQMQGIAASGAQWVRLDDIWPQVEWTQGSFNWQLPDRSVAAAVAAGIPNIDLIIDCYPPPWAENADGSPNAADFATFAQASAVRYSAMGVHTYEVCNEPNLGGEWNVDNDTTSVSEYTALLKLAYPAIKSADPKALVLLGGIGADNDSSSYMPQAWLQGIYADGGGGYFDAVSVHPYCWPAAPTDATTASWSYFYNLPDWIYATMAANGDGNKKVWITEFGYPTSPNSSYSNAVSPAQQATYITEAFNQAKQWPWVSALFVYNYQDGTDGTWDTYGLVDQSGTAKPALAAFEAEAQSQTATSTTTSDTTGTTTGTTPSTTTSTTSSPSGTTSGAVPGALDSSSVPSTPTNIVAALKGDSLTLTWTNPAGAQGDNIYRDGTKIASPGLVTSYQDRDVGAGSHTYYVTATDSAGQGPASNSVTVRFTTGPVPGRSLRSAGVAEHTPPGYMHGRPPAVA